MTKKLPVNETVKYKKRVACMIEYRQKSDSGLDKLKQMKYELLSAKDRSTLTRDEMIELVLLEGGTIYATKRECNEAWS
jgi:hypothetical protein